ncbi:phosphoribosyl-ATP pyrophosphohydrolase [Romboutsia maritimum]|uniref:Phosphoribosyl-ATP pyrophosphohydrolase n=1 Tax=Romboutsia maritimum TaxID=2020948 RepID=A0A371IVR8_9FIRM|nr:nucleoside triphosphate pyrophosphohydrolase [Romboutsia maritimum]RDY24583.1 phosphoribosyl-ATP pyrophosphohydrolase [Romboutsia maritimum]
MNNSVKLVRDKTPEIIESSGKKCIIENLDDQQMVEYLYVKFNEELYELFYCEELEGFADVMEVLFSIGKRYGYSEQDILRKRSEKKATHGSFDNNILLKHIY